MWVGIVSLFPEMLQASASVGVVGRAIETGIVDLELIQPRTFATDRHRTVDDRPYGGGPGMVMKVEPLRSSIAAAQAAFVRNETLRQAERSSAQAAELTAAPVIYLSPNGERLNQRMACELAQLDGMILLAGRYEGIDERLLDVVDREISIGDYVLSGGELPALVLLDAVARQLPGTLGNAASVMEESHLDGLLDYPHYTRPEIVPAEEVAASKTGVAEQRMAGVQSVPAVLLSGDHQAIQRWRRQQALWRTWCKRPDLLASRPLSAMERELLAEMFKKGAADH